MAAAPQAGSSLAPGPAIAEAEGPAASDSASSAPPAGNGPPLRVSLYIGDKRIADDEPQADEEMADVAQAQSSSDTLIVPLHTGLVYSSIMMLHAEPVLVTREAHEGHPEAPERISRAFQVLKDNGCVKRMKRIQPREVERDEVALVHDLGVWEGVWRSQCESSMAVLKVAQLRSAETETLCLSFSLYPICAFRGHKALRRAVLPVHQRAHLPLCASILRRSH